MSVKLLCFLTIALLLAGCNRQRSQPAVSGAGTVQAAAATGPGGSQAPAQNPEPAAQPLSAAQSTSPAQPGPAPAEGAEGNAVASTARAPMYAQPAQPQPAPGSVVPANAPFQGQAPQTANFQPAVLTIPAGTRIRVRIAETLDTRHSYRGQRFQAYLAEPIVSGERVVIPTGTTFEGHVIEARHSGRLRGRAYLGVTLDAFRLHGARYAVVTAPDFRASGSHKRRNLAFIGGGSGAGVTVGAVAGGPVGALVGAGAGAVAGTTSAFITGRKNVRLPVETPLVFSLRAPITVHG